MIVPTRQFVLLSLVPLMTSMGLYVVPAATPLILSIDIILATFALIDFLTVPRYRDLQITREINRIATRGEKHDVTLVVVNRGRKILHLHLKDDLDQTFQCKGAEIETDLGPKEKLDFEYDFTPTKRGEYVLKYVHVIAESRFRCWRRFMKTGPSNIIRVYPALKQIGRYALYARTNRMSLLGVRKTRRAGNDNEFERLRDYTPDDLYKAIDWRATSRRLKLTVKDFQSNQSQRVIFMIDCGRMMVNESNGFSLFDSAIDAALTLSYVALSKHDQVGLICFNNQVTRWIPPKSGRNHLNTLVHAVHDIEPDLVESRFDEAFYHLHQQVRKRSLIVLITNVIDDRNAHSVVSQTKNLVGKHLPLTVLFRDQELFSHAEAGLDLLDIFDSSNQVPNDVNSHLQLYRGAAAADILLWRDKVLTDMKHAGVLTLDLFSEDLTVSIVNEYLRVKARMLL